MMDSKKNFIDLAIKRVAWIAIASMLTILLIGEIAQAIGESLSK